MGLSLKTERKRVEFPHTFHQLQNSTTDHLPFFLLGGLFISSGFRTFGHNRTPGYIETIPRALGETVCMILG